MRLLVPSSKGQSVWPVALSGGLCAATFMLVWLGYQATSNARLSTRMLLERRVEEQLALLWAGLTQDMKGAHATVLVPVTPAQLELDSPFDLADTFARGFARFPYPEFFFAWKSLDNGGEVTYVFNRSDRPPAWHLADHPDHLPGPYPVELLRDPANVRDVIVEAVGYARYARPFAVFETHLEGTPYQVVANLLYHGDQPTRLFGLIGFAVDLKWVSETYFRDLALQLAHIGGNPDEVSLEIVDDVGRGITATRARRADGPSATRAFPLVFVDRALLGALAPGDQHIRMWTARASLGEDSRLSTTTGADITFVLIALAALVAVLGLAVTVRGVRVATELADMKSDFVSSVTHELKTPLSSIRLIADTLARGRYDSPRTIYDYAKLLSQESTNLTRLIDNLLAYGRLSDVRHAYTFEAVGVSELVDDALEHFEAVLEEQGFAVDVNVPLKLPDVRADRTSVVQALENVIDNAIKYSNGARSLQLGACAEDRYVRISVIDRGTGIDKSEIDRVCEKFYRGRGVKTGGSGLGLAIARQVVEDQGGGLRIESTPGKGTRVDVVLPIAAAMSYGQANSDR